MPWTICLPLPKKGEVSLTGLICFDIPVLVRRFEIPQPFFRTNLVKEKVVKDLQILATIDELASGLSSGVRKQVQDTVRRSAEAGGLPEGMKLNFGEQKQ
jgi:hypothetical protein